MTQDQTPNDPDSKNYDEFDLKQTFDTLKEMQNASNVLTLEQFKRFEYLYQKHPEPKTAEEKTSRDIKVSKLTSQLSSLIDFYKPTDIIQSQANPIVVLTLPQILTPVKSIQNTPENVSAVTINRRDASSDVPAYRTKAESRMANALLNQQCDADQIELIAAARRTTAALVQKFNEMRNKSTGSEDSSSPSETADQQSHIDLAMDDL